MKTKKSWWSLTIQDCSNFDLNDDDLRHISEMIKQGYHQGELIQEDNEDNEDDIIEEEKRLKDRDDEVSWNK